MNKKLLAACLFIACFLSFTIYTWQNLGHLLHIQEPIGNDKVDHIIVLMGGNGKRVAKASELYHEGKGDKILFALCEERTFGELDVGYSSSFFARALLEKKGVPQSAIKELSRVKVTSTIEEVQEINTFLLTNPHIKKIAFVTSWYHSSRLKWTVEQLLTANLDRIYFETSHTQYGTPEGWWKSEDGFLYVFNEILKWTYYLLIETLPPRIQQL